MRMIGALYLSVYIGAGEQRIKNGEYSSACLTQINSRDCYFDLIGRKYVPFDSPIV
jgi:hypothetical protein